MKYIKYVAALFLGCSMSFDAWAQEAEICNAVLSSGIRDNYYLLSDKDQYVQYQKRICNANFSSYGQFTQDSASLGLDVPLAEGHDWIIW